MKLEEIADRDSHRHAPLAARRRSRAARESARSDLAEPTPTSSSRRRRRRQPRRKQGRSAASPADPFGPLAASALRIGRPLRSLSGGVAPRASPGRHRLHGHRGPHAFRPSPGGSGGIARGSGRRAATVSRRSAASDACHGQVAARPGPPHRLPLHRPGRPVRRHGTQRSTKPNRSSARRSTAARNCSAATRSPLAVAVGSAGRLRFWTRRATRSR